MAQATDALAADVAPPNRCPRGVLTGRQASVAQQSSLIGESGHIPYGQKTRNRLDNRVYDLTTAHASACILSTLSCILHAHVRMEQMEGGRAHGLEDVTGVHHGFS